MQPRISPGDSGLHWGTHTLYRPRSSCDTAWGTRGLSRDTPRVPEEPWGQPSPVVSRWRGTSPLGAAPGTAPHSRDAQRGSTNVSIKRQGRRLNAWIAPCLDRHGSRGSFISSRPAQPAVQGQTDRPAGASPGRCRHCIKMPSAPPPALTFPEQLPGELGRGAAMKH